MLAIRRHSDPLLHDVLSEIKATSDEEKIAGLYEQIDLVKDRPSVAPDKGDEDGNLLDLNEVLEADYPFS